MSSTCPSCAAEVPPGAKFCGQCGAPQTARCPACGAQAGQSDQRFCLDCGAPLAAVLGPAPGPPAAPSEPSVAPSEPAVFDLPSIERRLVSVLFADLAGFTTFSESHDAE